MPSLITLQWSTFIHRVKTVRVGVWLLPVLVFSALYLYRPFVLGFYSDDWGILLESSFHGAPFSLERFLWHWPTFARPLMNIQLYVCTSVFGTSSIAWHFFMIALVALVYVLLRKFLLTLGARPTAATLASTVWLVFPWSLGYRAWPITSAILLSTICFLAGSISLLRQRLWSALAWYGASMLLYEAFYFQFAVILVILAVSPETRRWALRRAAPALMLLQLILIALNRLAAHYAPSLGKTYNAHWYTGLANLLPRIPLVMADGVVGGMALGRVVVFGSVLFALIAASRTPERMRRVKLLCAGLGVLIASFVLALAGYRLVALGMPSRAFVCVDIWLVVFLAMVWNRPFGDTRERRAFILTSIVIFAILATSTAVRTAAWQRVWDEERDVLSAVPGKRLAETDPDALIVVRGLPEVEGSPVFHPTWGMPAAVHRWVPDGVYRDYIFVRQDAMPYWDGKFIVGAYSGPLPEASKVWAWDWPTGTLRPITTSGRLF